MAKGLFCCGEVAGKACGWPLAKLAQATELLWFMLPTTGNGLVLTEGVGVLNSELSALAFE